MITSFCSLGLNLDCETSTNWPIIGDIGLWLVNADHMTWLLASDCSRTVPTNWSIRNKEALTKDLLISGSREGKEKEGKVENNRWLVITTREQKKHKRLTILGIILDDFFFYYAFSLLLIQDLKFKYVTSSLKFKKCWVNSNSFNAWRKRSTISLPFPSLLILLSFTNSVDIRDDREI